MHANNPYQAPSAAVADQGAEECAPVKVFGASGRIGRVRYIGYRIGFALLFCVLVIAGVILRPGAGQLVPCAGNQHGSEVTRPCAGVARFGRSGWPRVRVRPSLAYNFWSIPLSQGVA